MTFLSEWNMEPTRPGRIKRPWAVAAAGLTAAHHGFELASGIGLVLQPELSLAGSSALWGIQIPAWVLLAARGSRRHDGLLAALAGSALAGSLVHYFLWPWRRGRLGLPVLTEAEGLPTSALGAYNVILQGWAVVSVLSLLTEVPKGRRRWALAGFSGLPVLYLSARHHFTWISNEAVVRPAWWNRAISRNTDPADG